MQLCRRTALLAPMRRPQSRPYLNSIRTLPASLPRNQQRTPGDEWHHTEPS